MKRHLLVELDGDVSKALESEVRTIGHLRGQPVTRRAIVEGALRNFFRLDLGLKSKLVEGGGQMPAVAVKAGGGQDSEALMLSSEEAAQRLGLSAGTVSAIKQAAKIRRKRVFLDEIVGFLKANPGFTVSEVYPLKSRASQAAGQPA